MSKNKEQRIDVLKSVENGASPARNNQYACGRRRTIYTSYANPEYTQNISETTRKLVETLFEIHRELILCHPGFGHKAKLKFVSCRFHLPLQEPMVGEYII